MKEKENDTYFLFAMLMCNMYVGFSFICTETLGRIFLIILAILWVIIGFLVKK